MKRNRAVAIIVNDQNIVLIHRIEDGKEYYIFPGGGVEPGETVEQAVVREVREETSLEVTTDKLLYHHMLDDDTEHFFYLCTYTSGDLKLGEGNELQEMRESEKHFYNPVWCSIETLPQLLLYPLEIRDWLLEDIKTHFAQVPRAATLRVTDLRQTLS